MAENAYNGGDVRRMKQLLDRCDPDLRAWEWDRLKFLSDRSILTLRGHGEVTSVAFSPAGTRIVSGSSDTMLKVWETGKSQTGP